MKTIGSKQAADLARKKFGDHAFAMRQGRVFKVGTTGRFLFWNTYYVAGIGKSWAEALAMAEVCLVVTTMDQAIPGSDAGGVVTKPLFTGDERREFNGINE